jgi:hypothetical protein
MCDDVKATVDELSAKGVECTPVTDAGWGLKTAIRLPGGTPIFVEHSAQPYVQAGVFRTVVRQQAHHRSIRGGT